MADLGLQKHRGEKMTDTKVTDTKETAKFISSNPLFYSLSPQAIDSIAHKFHVQDYEPEETIINEGDPGDSFYIIQHGHVRVVKISDNAGELVMALMDPGQAFGEMALLTNQPRSATIKAIDGVRLLQLLRVDFMNLIRDYPALMVEMNKLLEQRVSLLDISEIEKAEELREKFKAARRVEIDFSVIDLVSRLNLAAGGQAQADHCKETAFLAKEMSKMLCPMVSDEIYTGAFLHEIGKVSVNEDILAKERVGEPLTAEEETEMNKIYKVALDILEPIKNVRQQISFLEFMDRKDYREMPMEAQIVKVASDFQELINPYYRGKTEESALLIMRKKSGSLCHPKVIAALEATLSKFQEMGVEKQINFIRAMNNALDAKDHYTRAHCRHVGEMAQRIAEKMGLERKRMDFLRLGCELHDVGKIWIPLNILNAPRKLTDLEFERMKTHTIESANFFAVIPGMDELTSLVRHHHEKYDGSGYPDKLKEEEIPLLARIMAVADVYSALITKRPYKDPMPLEKVLSVMESMQPASFDPEIFSIYREIILEDISCRG
ncbi:MAG: HD domain-containing protein [Firmicutes bacterium]|nr:HD domain-containing protein [Bacillota bacterium]